MLIPLLKKSTPLLLAALLLLVLCLILVNDDGLYRQPILQITSVTDVPLGKQTGDNGVAEKQYRQEITGVFRNGENRGAEVMAESQYSESQVNSTRYRTGDKVFVRLSQGAVTLLSAKRDVWLLSALALFTCTLCLFYRGRGCLILSSLLLNVTLLWLTLRYCEADDFSRLGAFFSGQWPFLILLFCVITLLFVGGFRRQTFGAILSTLATTFLVFLLYQFTLSRSAAIPYDMMSETFAALPVEDLFRFSVLAGSLGAVMDVAVAIHVSVGALAGAEKKTDLRSLLKSLREIGADIMGTMINVLFFSYISASLPLEILKISSGYTLTSILRYDLVFDFARFLLGAIGIVLAIPVSGGIALLLCGKERG